MVHRYGIEIGEGIHITVDIGDMDNSYLLYVCDMLFNSGWYYSEDTGLWTIDKRVHFDLLSAGRLSGIIPAERKEQRVLPGFWKEALPKMWSQ